MSTKIYNAYRYYGDAGSLFNWLVRFRKRYWKMCAEHVFSILGSDQGYQHRVYSILRDVFKEGVRDVLNVSADAVVYLYDGRVFVQFFGVHDAYQMFGKRFRLSYDFSDYHYQNQTDEPSHLSEQEWDERRKTWDAIMRHSDVPANAGLTFHILHQSNLIEFSIFATKDR